MKEEPSQQSAEADEHPPGIRLEIEVGSMLTYVLIFVGFVGTAAAGSAVVYLLGG